MDTDVEVLKPLDDLLEYEAVSGFETNTNIPTGLMAACKGQRMFVEFLHDYDDKHFRRKDGSLDTTTNVTRITNICMKYGFVPNNQKQTINGLTLLPKDYLCPKDHVTKELNITTNTFVIHHFDGSWLTEEDRYKMKLIGKLHFLPNKITTKLAAYISTVKFRGFKAAHSETMKFIRKKGNEYGFQSYLNDVV